MLVAIVTGVAASIIVAVVIGVWQLVVPSAEVRRIGRAEAAILDEIRARFPERSAPEAWQEILRRLDSHGAELENFRRYGRYAKVDRDGDEWHGDGGGMRTPTAVTDWHGGALTSEGDRLRWECDQPLIQACRDTIAGFPDYPFPHVILGSCLRIKNQPGWKQSLERGREILEFTTKVEHIPDHENFLNYIKGHLREQVP